MLMRFDASLRALTVVDLLDLISVGETTKNLGLGYGVALRVTAVAQKIAWIGQ